MDKLTVSELKAKAKQKGLKGYSKLNKSELINLINTKSSGVSLSKKDKDIISGDEFVQLSLPKNILSVTWEMVIIPKDTVLYRGAKTPIVENKATYLAPDIRTTNIYLPSKGKGTVYIYKTSKNISVLKIDSISNANKLMEIVYGDKTVRSRFGTKKQYTATMYDIIRKFFTGALVHSDTKACQISKTGKIIRYSSVKDDFIFSNWLCENGFEGYAAPPLPMKFGGEFPAEIMLCMPLDKLEFIKKINISKQKDEDNLLSYV